MKPYPLCRLGNTLYKHAFWLYFPLYRIYKAVSERTERRLISQVVKPGQCIVDIGANIGIYTCLFSKLVGPTGEVHAFEPEHKNFQHLQHLTRHLCNVTLHQLAIGLSTGQLTLYCSNELNVDHRTYFTSEMRPSQTVNSITLDDYIQGKPVDFIKMDIQGYEYAALQGMQKTLQRNPSLWMIMELSPYHLQLAGSNQEDVVRFLQARYFQIFLIQNSNVVPLPSGGMPCKETQYHNLVVIPQALNKFTIG
ncbi:MAG: FkbM family methyltransferase [Candidatus Vecturithrix sp.]|nr:FkbM family methyltransferase [Candidatus Vecturithrix sp.]